MSGLLKTCKFICGNKRYIFSSTTVDNDNLPVFCRGIAKASESSARIGIGGLN
jgi:hypothetical protein